MTEHEPEPTGRVGQISVAAAIAGGVVLGLRADEALSLALHLFGYPAALVVIVRFVPVVKQRRLVWFLVHEAAMVSICIGLAVDGRWLGIIPNALWPVIAWYWYFSRRHARTDDDA